MEKSEHNNYIDWYDRNWSLLVKSQIIPNEKQIFELFSQKFFDDANDDLGRWRKKLWDKWKVCATSCHEIHNILSWNIKENSGLKTLVEDIVKLDYWSLWEVFQRIKLEYFNKWWNEKIIEQLDNICKSIDEMWRISKRHTNVISKS